MLFFDDEHRNIHDIGALGVRTQFVPEGMTWRMFRQGMQLD
jgi:hypothetical protein